MISAAACSAGSWTLPAKMLEFTKEVRKATCGR
jgi:hypothetical protein